MHNYKAALKNYKMTLNTPTDSKSLVFKQTLSQPPLQIADC